MTKSRTNDRTERIAKLRELHHDLSYFKLGGSWNETFRNNALPIIEEQEAEVDKLHEVRTAIHSTSRRARNAIP